MGTTEVANENGKLKHIFYTLSILALNNNLMFIGFYTSTKLASLFWQEWMYN